MSAPKPTPHVQNWQVQDLDGTAIAGQDYKTESEAALAALLMRVELQRPVRVRRTA